MSCNDYSFPEAINLQENNFKLLQTAKSQKITLNADLNISLNNI